MDKTELREALVMMIRKMPDEELEEARQMLKAWVEARELRAPGRKLTFEERLLWMRSLPEEDYEMTEEERASLEEGRKDIKAGRVHKFEDVARELDM